MEILNSIFAFVIAIIFMVLFIDLMMSVLLDISPIDFLKGIVKSFMKEKEK